MNVHKINCPECGYDMGYECGDYSYPSFVISKEISEFMLLFLPLGQEKQ